MYFVVLYKKEYYICNLKFYIMKDRVLKIIDDLKLTTSEFALRVGAQPAQISHIKTGRNQVTLDIVTKILKAYPSIDSDWLLFGKGNMYKKAPESTENQPSTSKKQPIQLEMADLFDSVPNNSPNENKENELIQTHENNEINSSTNSDQVEEKVSSVKENSPEQSSAVEIRVNQPTSSNLTNNGSEVNDVTTNKADNLNNIASNQITEKKDEDSRIINEKPHPYVKKIVVFYSDKTYDEFLPTV